MKSSPDITYRRFLLGIASEDEECRAEEAILKGALDAFSLQTAEDELLDEYLFDNLTSEEKKAFEEHFLVTEDRRQRLRFAATLLEYAQTHPTESDSLKPQLIREGSVRATLFWKRAAFLAAAATVLLATLVIFDKIRLRRQTQIANDAHDELIWLQSSLAAAKSGIPLVTEHPTGPLGSPLGTADQIVAIELASSTRSVYPLMLHIPGQARFLRIDIEIPLPLAARYREVVLTPSGEDLWAQEFPASILPTPAKSSIVLPASILRPGTYVFRLEAAEAEGNFSEAAEWVLQVPKE